MAVFRIEKTRDYTVMSNYHLRDRSLSLKAKGLLSLMLSLPEDWDYTMKGLARICKDGIDSISGGIRELEAHGYLVRARVRNENGQLGSIEYTILEQPKEPAQTPAPIREKPIRENPIQVKPMLDAPIQENPAQLNTKEQNKELSITQGSSPIPSSPPTPREKSRIGQDRMRERESYREIILENIDYDILTQDEKLDRDRLDELVELMVDTVCSNREMVRVAGDDYPAEVVRSRFLKLNASHIEITDQNIRAFSSTAKKYGLDFALKKDTSGELPRYLVFFKGRDADVITAAFREFSAKNLSREKAPSIRRKLEKAQEQSKTQHKEQERGEKVKTRERSVER